MCDSDCGLTEIGGALSEASVISPRRTKSGAGWSSFKSPMKKTVKVEQDNLSIMDELFKIINTK